MSYQRKRVEGVDDERLKFELCTMLSREVMFFIITFDRLLTVYW